MIAKEIKAVDFLGNERKETFRFNLTMSELRKWELGVTGGLSALLEQISATQDIPKVVEFICQFIDAAYGVMSADGRKFEKSEAILNDFKSTMFYDALWNELVEDADKAAEFINQVVSKEVLDKAKEAEKMLNNQNHPAFNK